MPLVEGLPYELLQLRPDKDDSAFSRGWEAHRRGDTESDNPFHPETSQFEWWREGFAEFRDKEMRKYPTLKERDARFTKGK